MKRKASYLLLSGLLFFAVFFQACKKERSMTLTVTVKMLNDTTVLVPQAKVQLEQGSVLVEGYTDGHGEFRHIFNLPVQLNINVYKVNGNDTLYGVGIVNVSKEGTDYNKSVFIF